MRQRRLEAGPSWAQPQPARIPTSAATPAVVARHAPSLGRRLRWPSYPPGAMTGRDEHGAHTRPTLRPQVPECPSSYRYVGGEFFNESVASSSKYADFMFKLTEKFKRGLSVKYQVRGRHTAVG